MDRKMQDLYLYGDSDYDWTSLIGEDEESKEEELDQATTKLLHEFKLQIDITLKASYNALPDSLKRKFNFQSAAEFRLCSLVRAARMHLDHVEKMKSPYECAKQMLVLKPYINFEDPRAALQCIRNEGRNLGFNRQITSDAHRVLTSIVSFMEPSFHPLVREGYIDSLLSVIDHKAREWCHLVNMSFTLAIDNCECEYQSVVVPILQQKIEASPVYRAAEAQVELHQKFHKHITSLEFIKHDMNVKDLVKHEMVKTPEFFNLDEQLIQISLEERLKTLKLGHEVDVYVECWEHLIDENDEQVLKYIDELVNELDGQGFFDVSALQGENSTRENWDPLLLKFRDVKAFRDIPTHILVHWIMDYRYLFSSSINYVILKEGFGKVLRYMDLKRQYLESLYEDMKCFDNDNYRVYQQPIRMRVIYPGDRKRKHEECSNTSSDGDAYQS